MWSTSYMSSTWSEPFFLRLPAQYEGSYNWESMPNTLTPAAATSGSRLDFDWFSCTFSTSAGSAESERTGCRTVAGTGSAARAIEARTRGERSVARLTRLKTAMGCGRGRARSAWKSRYLATWLVLVCHSYFLFQLRQL